MWQYWQHTKSGEQYAVRVENGVAVEACGPLHHSEVTAKNLRDDNFNGNAEDGEWVQANAEDFKVVLRLPVREA